MWVSVLFTSKHNFTQIFLGARLASNTPRNKFNNSTTSIFRSRSPPVSPSSDRMVQESRPLSYSLSVTWNPTRAVRSGSTPTLWPGRSSSNRMSTRSRSKVLAPLKTPGCLVTTSSSVVSRRSVYASIAWYLVLIFFLRGPVIYR